MTAGGFGRGDRGGGRTACGNCGAAIDVPPAGGHVTCAFCKAPLYVEVTGTLRHFAFRPRVEAKEAAGNLNAWLFSCGVEDRASVTETRLVYYPFWRVTRGDRVAMVPASATSEGALEEIPGDAGEMVPYDPDLERDATLVAATSYPPGTPEDVWLVHVPVLHITYDLAGRIATVLVLATSGRVVASEPPAGSVGASRASDSLVLWGGLGILLLTGVLVPWSAWALIMWLVTGTAVFIMLAFTPRRKRT